MNPFNEVPGLIVRNSWLHVIPKQNVLYSIHIYSVTRIVVLKRVSYMYLDELLFLVEI